MSEPTTEETDFGVIGVTERGWPQFAEFIDLYNSRIRVQFSSRAFHPACWVWIEQQPDLPKGMGVGQDGAGHLTLPQATQLRDALTAFIGEAERLIEAGHYWPEPTGDEAEEDDDE